MSLTNLIEFKTNDGEVNLKFSFSRLDSSISDFLRAELLVAVPTPADRIVVDMQQVEFADSVGLSILLRLNRFRADLTKRVVLNNLCPQMREVLRLTGLENVFEIK